MASASGPIRFYIFVAFALPLCLLFNKSLGCCVFPDRWKLPFVTPIFKSGKSNDVSNYGGIAILSTLGKLFELLVYRFMSAGGLSTRLCFPP
jgi:hypothetical protein